MKLSRIWLNQFQTFKTPFEVKDLDAGINVLAGPNESGKSTLVRAIRAAFFERHRSTSLSELQPWGDSSAAPEVSLQFTWQASQWTLNKRFLKRQRCDLTVDGDRLSGDEAEDRLAALLGYQMPNRGGSKPEHWGIPGLLWIEQGAGQQVRHSVGHASDHLQSALVGSLGDALNEMASSGGDALIKQVEVERARLLTTTGKPTGDYRDAQQACARLKETLESLDQAVKRYQDSVDRLDELGRQQQDVDAARPWEAQQHKADAAAAQLQAVEQLQQRQAQETRDLDDCQRQQRLYREQLEGIKAQQAQLVQRRQEMEQAGHQQAALASLDDSVEQRQTQAQCAYQAAATRLEAARRQARSHQLREEQARWQRQAKQLAQALENARDVNATLQQDTQQYQRDALDSTALSELQQVESELATLAIQQQALATRLDYSLEPDAKLTLGTQGLSGEGAIPLLEPTELGIPGVGKLVITPGGSDVADLTRQRDRLQARRRGLLERLGVSDLAQAQTRANTAQALHQRIQQTRARLEGLAPQGINELENQHRQAVQSCTQLDAALAKLAEGEPRAVAPQGAHAEPPGEAQAEADLAQAEQALRLAERAHQEHQRKLSLAHQAREAATREWQRLHDQLHGAEQQHKQEQALEALNTLKATQTQLNASLQGRQQQIEAANPALLAQDRERCTKAAESLRQQAHDREAEITRLKIQLETLGADGLEEQRDDTRLELEAQQRRLDQLSRRASALTLLLDLLKEQRQEVTVRLQAPLQKHLNRYLKLLFADAELTVDETLKPDTLIRQLADGEERGDLDAFSFGAREQMGLITRLAYADLLQEARRPTLIILDDALVHCDQARREQMTRILFDAAQRHQILLLTCHPENWQDLGVVPRDMRTLQPI